MHPFFNNKARESQKKQSTSSPARTVKTNKRSVERAATPQKRQKVNPDTQDTTTTDGILNQDEDELQDDHEEESDVEQPQSKKLHPFQIQVIERTGDLFDAPPGSVLIHACNCIASWGAGIAAQFKKRYPIAHKIHQDHSRRYTPAMLLGTALLIPPSEKSGPEHWVGCLFTSKGVGGRKDDKKSILNSTRSAMIELLKEITREGPDMIKGIYMCKINSGLFNIPWTDSKRVVQEIGVDMKGMQRKIYVIAPP